MSHQTDISDGYPSEETFPSRANCDMEHLKLLLSNDGITLYYSGSNIYKWADYYEIKDIMQITASLERLYSDSESKPKRL